MSFYVYVHTNKVNGKRYVGLTTTKPEYRWRKNGTGYVKQPRFYRSIQKYGWDNFDHQVFEVNTKDEMYYLEQYLITFYDTMNSGYNLSRGGESGNNQMKNSYSDEYIKSCKRKYNMTHKDQAKEYREEHKEHLKKKKQEYYQAHKDQIKARVNKYRNEHKEQVAESKKKWANEHKDELKEYHKKWVEDHKEERNEYNRTYLIKYRKKTIIEK